jgi:hypothetical protein
MRSTNPLSPPFPSHGFMMTAFSGCNAACSGFVSIMITLLRSRFRYERSCLSALTRADRIAYLDDLSINGSGGFPV